MEEVRRVLRPWPERMTASAPADSGFVPAVRLRGHGCFPLVLASMFLPGGVAVFLHAPSMGLLAAALAMWAAIYLFAYEREYAGVPVEAGEPW